MFGDVQQNTGLYASLVAAGVSALGLFSMAALGDWGRRHSAYFSAFAIGVLVVAVLFHLTPETLEYSPDGWMWIAIGFLAMAFIGFGIELLTDRPANKAGVAFGYASIIALGFHSFVDGLIYETTFHAELFTGWLATFGLLLHEFPEGVIAFFLAREAGLSRLWATFWAFIAASLTTIAGAAATSFWIENVNDLPVGPLLGATAGCLVYIMIFHLGPHASLTPNRRGYLWASAGVVVGIAALVFRHIGH